MVLDPEDPKAPAPAPKPEPKNKAKGPPESLREQWQEFHQQQQAAQQAAAQGAVVVAKPAATSAEEEPLFTVPETCQGDPGERRHIICRPQGRRPLEEFCVCIDFHNVLDLGTGGRFQSV